MNNIEDLSKEIEFKDGGIIKRRAAKVLDEALALLEEVNDTGLFNAIEKGLFAEVKRAKGGGKGQDGVFEKKDDYWNPCEEYLKKKLCS
jgi:beta-lysine 5,6-aminomutase alpha subunit